MAFVTKLQLLLTTANTRRPPVRSGWDNQFRHL